MDKYKILLVEDERQMAMFIEMELIHEGYNVDTAYDGIEGIKKIKNGEYSLVLLDIMLPGLNGMEICKRVREFSDIPIIMLTAMGDVKDKVKGLDIGADDYLTKPFVIEELLARIRVIARKSFHKMNKNEIKIRDVIMNRDTREVRRDGKLIELTKKEYDLLEILLVNKDIVLTREQLIEKIWGCDYAGGDNVVDVFIRYLRSKIDDEYEVKLITTVRGVGYVIRGDKK